MSGRYPKFQMGGQHRIDGQIYQPLEEIARAIYHDPDKLTQLETHLRFNKLSASFREIALSEDKITPSPKEINTTTERQAYESRLTQTYEHLKTATFDQIKEAYKYILEQATQPSKAEAHFLDTYCDREKKSVPRNWRQLAVNDVIRELHNLNKPTPTTQVYPTCIIA